MFFPEQQKAADILRYQQLLIFRHFSEKVLSYFVRRTIFVPWFPERSG